MARLTYLGKWNRPDTDVFQIPGMSVDFSVGEPVEIGPEQAAAAGFSSLLELVQYFNSGRPNDPLLSLSESREDQDADESTATSETA